MACSKGLHPDLHLSAASTGPGVQTHSRPFAHGENPASPSAQAESPGVQGGAANKPFSHGRGVKWGAHADTNGVCSGTHTPGSALEDARREDGSIDWNRWGIENGESPVDEQDEDC